MSDKVRERAELLASSLARFGTDDSTRQIRVMAILAYRDAVRHEVMAEASKELMAEHEACVREIGER